MTEREGGFFAEEDKTYRCPYCLGGLEGWHEVEGDVEQYCDSCGEWILVGKARNR